ncbi:MBL fold metallo-hydrolase [Thiohalophilus thiocyanatoxydans]|uniref:Glyoxylase-like metal-dependent hydrolase (Beta-lactamase superfamily II) n=1 Tax=Thiohalophilus thiocyanatoxydans TaxID=381308 RepID=A0A4R8IUV5_9GAMM|nr:MBL fold metallo-hydrolase [Thiohalophilus thiocyanatoxydans]TDY04214.1 glyoxylase-like metal-dependent hydrolase (beta-lactamase superfamily II) [Thiohalophilus thiocyanatoxydans]
MFSKMYRLLTGPFGFLPLLLLLPLTAVQAEEQIPEPAVEKINDRVYALLGPIGFPSKENHGYMVNSAVLIGDEGVVLIDTGFSNEIGRHLKNTIAGITDKPVTHIINTHHHGDHILGNSAFPDAEIISSKQCRELVEKEGHNWIGILNNMTGKEHPDTRPVPAQTVYPQESRTDVTLQGIPMELWAPAGSHTPGDMMVYLPQDKLLISGDILVKKMIPSFVDAHVGSWIDTLAQIEKREIETVIPGHGPLMTLAEVKAMHQRMADLYAGIEAGYNQGLMDSEIRKTLDLSQWKKMKEFEGQMGININRAYLEIERESF